MSQKPSGRFSMSGRPLMVIPCASASSRAEVTIPALVVGAVTRDVDDLSDGLDAAFPEMPGLKSMAPEMDV